MTALTFADVVQFASENDYGTLAGPVNLTETEGKTWEIPVHIDPGDGNTLDLSSVTVTAEVLDGIEGATLATFTAGTWQATSTGVNYVLLTLEKADTADLAGDGKLPRALPWFCTLSSGGDDVAVWGAQESSLVINQGD